MKIIDRYIFFEILKKSIYVLISLVSIFSFFKFLEELDRIGEKQYTISTAMQYLFLSLPAFFNMFTVLGLLIGTIFSIGQMNSSKELQIMHTASVSRVSLIKKSIIFPFLVSIVLIIFFETISPHASDLAFKIRSKALGNLIINQDENFWLKRDDKIIFFQYEKNNEKSAHIFQLKNNLDLISIVKSDRAFLKEKYIDLEANEKFELDSNRRFFNILKSSSDDNLRINFDSEQITSLNKKISTMSIKDLVNAIRFSYVNDLNYNNFLIELETRIIKPISLAALILLALPFVMNLQRNTSIANRVFIALCIGIVFHLLSKASTVLAMKFPDIASFGAILPSLVLMTIGIILIRFKLRDV